jgi:DNA-binding LytR/AlgR family response regulator
MPGLSGLEVATALADDWPVTAGPFPLVVFVTAYDQYALAAFEAQAADYVLKPLDPRRVGQCVARLQARLAERMAQPAAPDEAALMAVVHGLAQLQQRVGVPSPAPVPPPAAIAPLRYLQASQGATLHVVPLAEVLVIEAADRYLRLLTADAEHLIRTPLRELQAQLPEDDFWQIHRSVLVRASAIARVHRDDSGKLTLSLRQRPETWTVSRLHAARFRAM